MGLNTASAKVLSGVKALGADFSKVAMLARQNLVADRRVLASVYALHGVPDPEPSRYSEPFFEALGAESIHSFDASDFEGATFVHDMNTPIPDEHKGRYTLLFDGGTTEHVFNVPQALTNAMQMVKVGGHYVQSVPANNWMGHGFWQFCPEYAYRVFSPDNGFEPIAVLVHENGRPFYRALDPKALGWRVPIRNRRPTMLTVVARKIADKAIFEKAPQQSDYSAAWAATGKGAERRTRIVDLIRRAVPGDWERLLRPAFRNRSHVRLSDDDVMRGRFTNA